MTKGSTMQERIPEHEIKFDPEGGHNHDGVGSAPVQSSIAGDLNGIATQNQVGNEANGVQVSPGITTEAGGGALIEVNTTITADVTAPVGPNGVDQPITRPAVAPGKWYYLYLVKDSNGIVYPVISESSTGPDLSDPAFDGYVLVSAPVAVLLDQPPGTLELFKITGGSDRRMFSYTNPQPLGPLPVAPVPGPLPMQLGDGTPVTPQLNFQEEVDITLQSSSVGGSADAHLFDYDYPGGPGQGKISIPNTGGGSPVTVRGSVFAGGGVIQGHDIAGNDKAMFLNGFVLF